MDTKANLQITVVVRDMVPFKIHNSNGAYMVHEMDVVFRPASDGVLKVGHIRAQGRKILKDGESLHSVVTRYLSIHSWGVVPITLREEVENAAREVAERVRLA